MPSGSPLRDGDTIEDSRQADFSVKIEKCPRQQARLQASIYDFTGPPLYLSFLTSTAETMSQEDFDLHSLASYLHLTPPQIERMASRGKLPGRRVSGNWRFSQAEIHHWLEERIGASDEQELRKVEKVLDSKVSESLTSDIRITDLIVPANICIPLPARTRNSVIEKLCDRAVEAGALWDAFSMAEALRAREELHPTALDNGVALLHPRRPQADLMPEPFIGLGVTTGGIPFGGPRGSLTDIFFLIASSDEAGHLRVLARLSRLIGSQALLEQLRTASDSRQALRLISDVEDSLD